MHSGHRRRESAVSPVRRNAGRRSLRIEQCETRLLLSADFDFGPLLPRFEPAIAEQIIVLRHEEAFRLSHHANTLGGQVADGYIEVLTTGSFRISAFDSRPALKADESEKGPPVTFSDEAINSRRATGESSGDWSGATDGNIQLHSTSQVQDAAAPSNSSIERIVDKDLPREEDDGLIDPTPSPDDPAHVPAPQIADRGDTTDSLPDDFPLRPASSRIEGASGRDEAFDLASIYPVRAMQGDEAGLSARQAEATDAAIDEGFANVLFASNVARDAAVPLVQAVGTATGHAPGRPTQTPGERDALTSQSDDQDDEFTADAAASKQFADNKTPESQPPVEAARCGLDLGRTDGAIQESREVTDFDAADGRPSTVFARLDSERPRNLVLVLAAAALAEYLAKDNVKQSQSQADPADLRPLSRRRRP